MFRYTLIGATCAVALSAAPANAQTVPETPFIANMEVESGGATTRGKIYFDEPMMRVDLSGSEGPDTYFIIDRGTLEATMVTQGPSGTMAVRMQEHPLLALANPGIPEGAKPTSRWTPWRRCRNYDTSNGSGCYTRDWIPMEVTSADGTVTRLTRIKRNPKFAADIFSVPAGVKVMTLPKLLDEAGAAAIMEGAFEGEMSDDKMIGVIEDLLNSEMDAAERRIGEGDNVPDIDLGGIIRDMETNEGDEDAQAQAILERMLGSQGITPEQTRELLGDNDTTAGVLMDQIEKNQPEVFDMIGMSPDEIKRMAKEDLPDDYDPFEAKLRLPDGSLRIPSLDNPEDTTLLGTYQLLRGEELEALGLDAQTIFLVVSKEISTGTKQTDFSEQIQQSQDAQTFMKDMQRAQDCTVSKEAENLIGDVIGGMNADPEEVKEAKLEALAKQAEAEKAAGTWSGARARYYQDEAFKVMMGGGAVDAILGADKDAPVMDCP